MPRVTVEIPSMLAGAAGGARRHEAEGATWQAALADLFARHPALKVHVLDEQGTLRPHVLCFVDDRNTRWDESQPLAEGSRITILQAVSGG
jgi:molybdopterin converting factor small subunit